MCRSRRMRGAPSAFGPPAGRLRFVFPEWSKRNQTGQAGRADRRINLDVGQTVDGVEQDPAVAMHRHGMEDTGCYAQGSACASCRRVRAGIGHGSSGCGCAWLGGSSAHASRARVGGTMGSERACDARIELFPRNGVNCVTRPAKNVLIRAALKGKGGYRAEL